MGFARRRRQRPPRPSQGTPRRHEARPEERRQSAALRAALRLRHARAAKRRAERLGEQLWRRAAERTTDAHQAKRRRQQRSIHLKCIIAITSGPGGPGGIGGGGAVEYDPAANPYTLEFANVMGLPVTDRTVVVIEASEYSAEWMESVGDIVGAGLSQKSSDGEIALIGAGSQPVNFASGSLGKMPIGAGDVRGWFGKLPATGKADVAAAIIAAMKSEPSTLIVVHGYTEMSDIEAWDKLVAGKEGLSLHVVHIGNSSPELEGWAGERGGEAVVLSVDQIEYLKDAAAEEAASEDE